MIRVAVEPYRTVRTRKHKLIVWESKKQSLFDLASDPGEERDLIGDAKFAGVARDLREKLAARCRETNDRAAAWLNS